jgi:hypothetical protein
VTVFTVTPTGEIRCPAESCHQQLTRLIIDMSTESPYRQRHPCAHCRQIVVAEQDGVGRAKLVPVAHRDRAPCNSGLASETMPAHRLLVVFALRASSCVPRNPDREHTVNYFKPSHSFAACISAAEIFRANSVVMPRSVSTS